VKARGERTKPFLLFLSFLALMGLTSSGCLR